MGHDASISPDVASGSSVTPTPACFAAGYVIAGVHHRRKCRPRGIFIVGGGGTDVTKNSDIWDSSAPPPTAGACIHWLTSPSDNVNSGIGGSFSSMSRDQLSHCNAEASVNWLLSPYEEGERLC